MVPRRIQYETTGKVVNMSNVKLRVLRAAACLAASCGATFAAETAKPAVEFQSLRYDDSQATREAALYYTKLSLGDESDLSVGGQLRWRAEWWDNYNSKPVNDDEFLLARIRLHADARLFPALRFFVEGRSAFSYDRDIATPDGSGKRPIDEDSLDLENAFGDITVGGDVKATARIGRQEMNYGSQRVIGVLDWANTRRTFDGARLIVTGDGWRVDAFATRLVQIQRYEFNDGYIGGQDFYGIYATKNFKDVGATLDVYALNRLKHNTSTNTVDDNRDTLGARLNGKFGASGFDYEVEGSYQTGEAGASDIDAYSIAAVLGYNVPDCPYSSRLYAEYDYATGGTDPKDKNAERYDPLYPTGHMFFGLVDAIGRANIQDICIGLRASPVKKLKCSLEGHWFERAETTDGVFDAGGNQIIAAAASNAKQIGQEVDITLSYAIDRTMTISGGFGYLFAGPVIEDSLGDDIATAYIGGQFTF
jgi:hypothetical protein